MQRPIIPPSVQAVVLAGGAGSRMPPLASPTSPKALLTIANRPMLFYPLFALYRSCITNVTVVVERGFEPLFSTYVRDAFPTDSAVKALSLPALSITIVARADDAGTADVLRTCDLHAHETIVLAADSVCDVRLEDLLCFHRDSNASCTVTLAEDPSATSVDGAGGVAATGKAASSKSGKSKAGDKASGTRVFQPDHIALMSQTRLLMLLNPGDITASATRIAAPLLRLYNAMSMRSDLTDPHVYIVHTGVLKRVLRHCAPISSVKYDLVPYLTRRQHVLTKVADREAWSLPGDDVLVCAYVARSAFAVRANTVENFRDVNMRVAGGGLAGWLSGVAPAEEDAGTAAVSKKKKKKGGGSGGGGGGAKAAFMFEKAGERVSVTVDSAVGPGCQAGDKTSVKKSVIGEGCTLGANVKLNGCVLLKGVYIGDGSNLANCVVCEDGRVEKQCVLKECRVANGAVVEDGTEAADRSFGKQGGDGGGLELDEALGDEIEFF